MPRIATLLQRLRNKLDHFEGLAGVAVCDLSTGEQAHINGAIRFPAASTIKVHILAALTRLHFDDEIDLNTRVEVEDRITGSPVLGCLDDSVSLTLRDLANLMIISSDNTATNILIGVIGEARMTSLIQSWGLRNTELRRKMKDLAAAERGYDNVTTPLDSILLLQQLWIEAFNASPAETECLRILNKPKKSRFRDALPPDTLIANKPGDLPGVLCEMAIVRVSNRPYAVSLMSSAGPEDVRDHTRWFIDTAHALYDELSHHSANPTP